MAGAANSNKGKRQSRCGDSRLWTLSLDQTCSRGGGAAQRSMTVGQDGGWLLASCPKAGELDAAQPPQMAHLVGLLAAEDVDVGVGEKAPTGRA